MFDHSLSFTPEPPKDAAYWLNHLGAKVDIREGELILSEDGFLTVGESPLPYSLYINQPTNEALPIVPRSDWRGRVYRFRRQDCVTLSAEWYDHTYGTSITPYLAGVGLNLYRDLGQTGFSQHIIAVGFTKVDDSPKHADVLVYGGHGHIGICQNGTHILHHLPNKLSCVDPLDESKVMEVYRRGY